MKSVFLCCVGLSLTLAAVSAPAAAGPFDKLKKAAGAVEDAAEDVKDAADAVEDAANGRPAVRPRGGSNGFANRGSTSNSPRTAKGKGYAGRAGPAPASLTSRTRCMGMGISNAMIGKVGDYTFSEGLSQEERSGFISREQVAPTDGCIMPSMGTHDYLYFEVDKKAYDATGNSNDWTVQCVDVESGKGADDPQPYRINVLAGKDLMLHCGNSEGIRQCASGSNSTRSGAWDRELKKRGKQMLSINMPAYHLDSGTDFYCQYYNKPSGKSLFAFQYRRSAG